ncbi:hypothetical protein [Maribacter sp. 2210JD10-5]|uniref:hypothetical protein n=1 Tax=Maribacter sp. 2210JD10-5 TaxID=3386272 RepID=UPI0039BC5854
MELPVTVPTTSPACTSAITVADRSAVVTVVVSSSLGGGSLLSFFEQATATSKKSMPKYFSIFFIFSGFFIVPVLVLS